MIVKPLVPLLLFGSSFQSACAQFFLPYNPYSRPENDENKKYSSQRGSCPAMNTLANHGFINRDGMNISIGDMASAGERVFGRSAEAIMSGALNAIELGVPVAGTGDDGLPTINLFDLFAHNTIEHDSSLVRQDSFFELHAQFNETIFQQMIANAVDGKITSADVDEHSFNRIFESRRTNPDVSYDFTVEAPVILTGHRVVLRHFDDPESKDIRVDYMESFLRDERIPDTFEPRIDRGLPALTDEDLIDEMIPGTLQTVAATKAPVTCSGSDHCRRLLSYGFTFHRSFFGVCFESCVPPRDFDSKERFGWDCGSCP
jgi:hypothetical protein